MLISASALHPVIVQVMSRCQALLILDLHSFCPTCALSSSGSPIYVENPKDYDRLDSDMT